MGSYFMLRGIDLYGLKNMKGICLDFEEDGWLIEGFFRCRKKKACWDNVGGI